MNQDAASCGARLDQRCLDRFVHEGSKNEVKIAVNNKAVGKISNEIITANPTYTWMSIMNEQGRPLPGNNNASRYALRILPARLDAGSRVCCKICCKRTEVRGRSAIIPDGLATYTNLPGRMRSIPIIRKKAFRYFRFMETRLSVTLTVSHCFPAAPESL